MGIQEWSEQILVVDLSDDPLLSDDLDALVDFIDTHGPRDVLIELRGASYINSSNIAKLLKIRKQAESTGRQLRLCEIPDSVWSVFLVTGLDNIFDFSDSVSTALAELQMEGS